MGTTDVQAVIERVEQLLGQEVLSDRVESAVQQLLNVVEALSTDKKLLADEVARLRKQLEQKKLAKTTSKNDDDDGPKPSTDHSSEKRRRPGDDRRSFKSVVIHETVQCPVDPLTLPPDAVRLGDEDVVVQDIEIRPKNTKFQRHVYYSAAQDRYFRGPLPAGYDRGDFGAHLRSLIVTLKYCGNMSEPKIGELLENFDVQVSSGTISNILTKTADAFEADYHDILLAGLASTPYQQTDDTSARVKGQFWHTHILCNPFYALYSTRPHKDRLAVLGLLQNVPQVRFRLGAETLELLEREFVPVPQKWQQPLAAVGEVEYTAEDLKALLDGWFGEGKNMQLRMAIEHAAAIVHYRHQDAVPVVRTLICDDAKQFKLLTDKLALCWIHEGRHYAKLDPVAPRYAAALDTFLNAYWEYYKSLQDYRGSPTEEKSKSLRAEFDRLFSTTTGYQVLDDRIAATAAKRDELLTVLDEPSVPLHNNDSELGARVSARRRDVSLHSRSVRGARAMDIFTTIAQTAKKLGRSAQAYLRDRLSGAHELPSLAESIRVAAASG